MNDPISVFFFGDSICFGQLVSPHLIWTTKLAARLEAALQPQTVVVNNASINGNTTRQALERMPYDIQSHRVDFLLVQFGMNDCNYWQTDCGVPRVSPGAFAANLHEIIARAVRFGARRVFLSTNHPTTRTQPFHGLDLSYQDSNASYNLLIREVAAEAALHSPVTLIDIDASCRRVCAEGTSLAELLLDDQLHLSRLGHEIYLEAVSSVMIPRILEDVRCESSF